MSHSQGRMSHSQGRRSRTGDRWESVLNDEPGDLVHGPDAKERRSADKDRVARNDVQHDPRLKGRSVEARGDPQQPNCPRWIPNGRRNPMRRLPAVCVGNRRRDGDPADGRSKLPADRAWRRGLSPSSGTRQPHPASDPRRRTRGTPGPPVRTVDPVDTRGAIAGEAGSRSRGARRSVRGASQG